MLITSSHPASESRTERLLPSLSFPRPQLLPFPLQQHRCEATQARTLGAKIAPKQQARLRLPFSTRVRPGSLRASATKRLSFHRRTVRLGPRLGGVASWGAQRCIVLAHTPAGEGPKGTRCVLFWQHLGAERRDQQLCCRPPPKAKPPAAPPGAPSPRGSPSALSVSLTGGPAAPARPSCKVTWRCRRARPPPGAATHRAGPSRARWAGREHSPAPPNAACSSAERRAAFGTTLPPVPSAPLRPYSPAASGLPAPADVQPLLGTASDVTTPLRSLPGGAPCACASSPRCVLYAAMLLALPGVRVSPGVPGCVEISRWKGIFPSAGGIEALIFARTHLCGLSSCASPRPQPGRGPQEPGCWGQLASVLLWGCELPSADSPCCHHQAAVPVRCCLYDFAVC